MSASVSKPPFPALPQKRALSVTQPGSEATHEVSLTSFHASPIGGGIAIGRDVSGRLIRAIVRTGIAARDPQPGEIWRFTGRGRLHDEYGWQLDAQVALALMPTGRALVRYLATNVRFPGVGWKTADRLWAGMGDGLYDALKNRDAPSLARVIGAERAVIVIAGCGLLAEEVEVFRWLDRYGVSPRTASAAAGLWGRGAIERIAANPYALTLLEPWRTVDERALRLGTLSHDHRRALSGIEECLSRSWRQGHTAATEEDVIARYRSIVTAPMGVGGAEALRRAIEVGRIIKRDDGLVQSRGAWFMEREVERLLLDRINSPAETSPQEATASAIAEQERGERYTLTKAQREAVQIAVGSRLIILSGGAGTGKTAVVRAIATAYEAATINSQRRKAVSAGVVLLALAGRAAKRLSIATGREASTIARFLRQLESGAIRFRGGLLVVDEASMIDLPILYRLLTALPPGADLLLVGDPAQLPPIGPGMPFHQLVDERSIPQSTLSIVHRQSEETGIAEIGEAIRNGRLPEIAKFNVDHPRARGVFYFPGDRDTAGKRTLEVFRAIAGSPPELGRAMELHRQDIQILTPLKGGASGLKALNEAIEAEWMIHQERLPAGDCRLEAKSYGYGTTTPSHHGVVPQANYYMMTAAISSSPAFSMAASALSLKRRGVV